MPYNRIKPRESEISFCYETDHQYFKSYDIDPRRGLLSDSCARISLTYVIIKIYDYLLWTNFRIMGLHVSEYLEMSHNIVKNNKYVSWR